MSILEDGNIMTTEQLSQALRQLREENPDIALLLELYRDLDQIYSQSLLAAGLKQEEPEPMVQNTATLTLSVSGSSSKTI